MRLAYVALLALFSVLATLKAYSTLHGGTQWRAATPAPDAHAAVPAAVGRSAPFASGGGDSAPPRHGLLPRNRSDPTGNVTHRIAQPEPPVSRSELKDTNATQRPLTTGDLLTLVLPVLRTVDVPLDPPNRSISRNCTQPEVSTRTRRFRWQQPQEPMTVYYSRLQGAGVELHSSGMSLPPVRRVAPVMFSTAPISAALPAWRPWWQPGSVTPPEPPAFVVVFHNVWVKGGWILECRRAFTAGACYQGDADLQPVVQPRHVPRGFVLGDPWAHGYFHWTQEQLPRLAIMYNTLQRDPSIRIMAPFTGFATSFIVDVLGFNRSRLIGHAAEYHLGTAYYPSPMLCGHALLQPLLLLRHIVFSRFNLSDSPTAAHVTTVLFPLRNDSRQPLNHDALVASCRRRFPGVRFWEQNFRGWPVRRQIEAFNSADVVVGAHGANLANIVYMRHRSTVVEFVPGHTGNPCYYGLAVRLGMDYRAVVLAGRVQGQPNEVPEGEVLRHLAAVLQGGASPAP
eukprot:GGOE01049929.1.p1 GENE.GGOE01049929.1~~GGOE01049929.1.p1  ORF type:complete len:511 (-),score=103.63 GGOE01049929.1:125-1657(-)